MRAEANWFWLSTEANLGVFSWQARGLYGWVWAECLCFLDQAGLVVGAAARGAAQQQVLLVDQAVEQVLLSVVVVHLQEGHDRDPQPGEPGSPQPELKEGDVTKED